MSIAGASAVVVGVLAGKAATNFIFNYTKNEYEQKITELEVAYNSLEEHLNVLINLRSQLPSFWDDANAQEVSISLEDTISKTRDEMQTVKQFIGIFRTTVSELDGSGSLIKNTIDDLKALVSAGAKG